MTQSKPDPKPESAKSKHDLSFLNLGKGWVPIEWLIMVKCLDPDGEVRYQEVTSKTLNPVEALGMLTTMEDTMRRRLMRGARSLNEED